MRLKRIQPRAKCVYIAPLKSLARERLKEWSSRFGPSSVNWKVLELSGDTHHDAHALNEADVLICTPEKWRVWFVKHKYNAGPLSPFICSHIISFLTSPSF